MRLTLMRNFLPGNTLILCIKAKCKYLNFYKFWHLNKQNLKKIWLKQSTAWPAQLYGLWNMNVLLPCAHQPDRTWLDASGKPHRPSASGRLVTGRRSLPQARNGSGRLQWSRGKAGRVRAARYRKDGVQSQVFDPALCASRPTRASILVDISCFLIQDRLRTTHKFAVPVRDFSTMRSLYQVSSALPQMQNVLSNAYCMYW